MRRSRRRISMRRHRHSFRIGRMKGLTSIPVRYTGRRY